MTPIFELINCNSLALKTNSELSPFEIIDLFTQDFQDLNESTYCLKISTTVEIKSEDIQQALKCQVMNANFLQGLLLSSHK